MRSFNLRFKTSLLEPNGLLKANLSIAVSDTDHSFFIESIDKLSRFLDSSRGELEISDETKRTFMIDSLKFFVEFLNDLRDNNKIRHIGNIAQLIIRFERVANDIMNGGGSSGGSSGGTRIILPGQ